MQLVVLQRQKLWVSLLRNSYAFTILLFVKEGVLLNYHYILSHVASDVYSCMLTHCVKLEPVNRFTPFATSLSISEPGD